MSNQTEPGEGPASVSCCATRSARTFSDKPFAIARSNPLAEHSWPIHADFTRLYFGVHVVPIIPKRFVPLHTLSIPCDLALAPIALTHPRLSRHPAWVVGSARINPMASRAEHSQPGMEPSCRSLHSEHYCSATCRAPELTLRACYSWTLGSKSRFAPRGHCSCRCESVICRAFKTPLHSSSHALCCGVLWAPQRNRKALGLTS